MPPISRSRSTKATTSSTASSSRSSSTWTAKKTRGHPRLLDIDQAKSSPGLAFVSALAHTSDPPQTAARVAFNAIEAAKQLNHRLFSVCYDILRDKLESRALAQLEKFMGFQLDVKKLKTEEVRRNVVAGQIMAMVEDVLTVLDTRGLAVSVEQRQRIQRSNDPEELHAWLCKAVVATSADELFED